MPSWLNIDCNDNEAKIRGLEQELRDLQNEYDWVRRKRDEAVYQEYIDDNERCMGRIANKMSDIRSEINRLS